ncbi:MAG: sugar phosphate isomerase/epimerase [Bryobacterales bacterium]|nr:sugar phosphate isomerase/epimerase [Bryobacterales bacterium]
MRRALSTHLFVNHRLSTSTLQRILNAGIQRVEIFCARQHLDYHNPQQVQEVASYLGDSQLQVHSVHLPMFNDEHWGKGGPGSIVDIASPSKPRRIAAVDEVKRALDLADAFPFRFAVQHLGVGFDDEWSMHKVDAAFSSLDELKSFARQRGVEILIENIPNALSGARKLLEFFEITHLNLGVCFDVGHAHLMEGVEAAFELLEDRIQSLHVHDNNGTEDKHLFPGFHTDGTVNWKRTMELLRRGNDRYPLLLELKEDPAMADSLGQAMQVFDTLESL